MNKVVRINIDCVLPWPSGIKWQRSHDTEVMSVSPDIINSLEAMQRSTYSNCYTVPKTPRLRPLLSAETYGPVYCNTTAQKTSLPLSRFMIVIE